MKIRHGDLEQARRDPIAWRRSLAGSSGGGFGQHQVLIHAVHRFHRRNEQTEAAVDCLRELFDRHFDDAVDLARLEERLQAYVAAYRAQAGRCVANRVRVAYPLGPDLELVGQIARIDLIPGGGYAAWLFGKVPEPWRNQLRMPLLQHFVATRLRAPADEVSVGFYHFDAAAYESEIYAPRDIETSLREGAEVARILAETPD